MAAALGPLALGREDASTETGDDSHYLQAARDALTDVGYCLLRVPHGCGPADVAKLCESVWGSEFGVDTSYAGGTSSRDVVAAGVFTVNKEPPEVSVTQHSEKTYQDTFPAFIAFYARHAAPDGGATVLGDNEGITAALPHGMRRKLRELGVQYVRTLTNGMRALGEGEVVYQTWQRSFETQDREVVRCAAARAGDAAVWDAATGDLSLESRRSAFSVVPPNLRRPWRRIRPQLPLEDDEETKEEEQEEELLMNQLFTYHASHQERGPADTNMYAPWLHLPHHKRPYHSRWGDGTELSEDEFAALANAYESQCITVPVRTGEVLLVNNFRWTHGRQPYAGHRDILVVMSRGVQRRTRYALPPDTTGAATSSKM